MTGEQRQEGHWGKGGGAYVSGLGHAARWTEAATEFGEDAEVERGLDSGTALCTTWCCW